MPVSEGKGRPEKIDIDHILGGDASESEEDVIEIIPEETPAAVGAEPGAQDAAGANGGGGVGAEEAARLEKEIAELKDLYMRARADFENLRKRVERDRQEDLARLTARVVSELLPSIDNLDRALEQQGDEAAFREGVTLIRRQLDEGLRKLGVEPIEALGDPFDPVFHEAVTAEPREGLAPNTVIEEIRKGYTLGGRVIRPSLVKVVIPPPTAQAGGQGGSGGSDGQDHRD